MDTMASAYLERTPWTELRLEAVRSLVEPEPGDRVLDLGCAAGAISHYLSTLGCETVGVDAEPLALDKARELFPDSDLPARERRPAAVRGRLVRQGRRRRPRRAPRRRDVPRDARRDETRAPARRDALAVHAEPEAPDRAAESARPDPRAEPDPYRPPRRGDARADAARGGYEVDRQRVAAELHPRAAARRARGGRRHRVAAVPALRPRER